MKEILEQELSRIEVPKELHERCMAGVRQALLRQKRQRLLKAASVAAALVVCCILAASPAVSQAIRGRFSDITGRGGAVVGTEYTAAPGEVSIRLQTAKEHPAAEITLLFPEEFPWREIKEISLGAYRITDAEGNVLCEGTGSQEVRAVLEGGKARLALDILPETEGCLLEIISLYGHSKADAPLHMILTK